MAKNLRTNVVEGGLTVDPSVAPGYPAPQGTLLVRRGTNQVWQKQGALDTDWVLFSASVFPGSNSNAYYGSGLDGALVVPAGTTTLTREMECTTVVIDPGGILNTDGWVLRATVSIINNGTIRCNGNSSTTSGGATGGGAGGGRIYGAGASGGASNIAGGTAGGNVADQSKSLPINGATSGRGGSGGLGSGGAGGAAGTVAATTNRCSSLCYPTILQGFYPANTANLITGGSGGGGAGGNGAANPNSGGGGGGGVIGLAAPIVTNNSAIEARGGGSANAGNNNCGTGGGGGGGKVFVLCRQYTGNNPDVSGGVAGAPQGTGVQGSTGSTGYFQITTGA